jgi:hypothetical protein
VQLAVGWVLREMGNAYPDVILEYLEENGSTMSAPAFARAIERRDADERARLKQSRRRATAHR